MSKKIASGAQAILLDVKLGLGAFMPTLEEARKLSELMVEIGRLSGRKVMALLSDMNQPLGQAVGNALELKEAIQTLQCGGPADFRLHCLEVAGHMLVIGKKAASLQQGRAMAQAALNDGRAWDKFRLLVQAQGGDVSSIDHPERLPQAPVVCALKAGRAGWLAQINARVVGETSVEMGAGRERKDDPIDHGVGIIVHHKVGDWVEKDEILFTLHARSQDEADRAGARLAEQSLAWSDSQVAALPLFYGVVE
jgi:pyrimidine-nucleoside phosphorylase